ncbi:MAG: hypothetical protein U1E89_21665 [Burkholderiaceae bacterium]
MHGTAAVIIVAALFGCAAAPSPPPAVATAVAAEQKSGDMVCTREYPTGSNIPITKCRTREQIEAERAAAHEGLRRHQTGGPNAKMGDQ